MSTMKNKWIIFKFEITATWLTGFALLFTGVIEYLITKVYNGFNTACISGGISLMLGRKHKWFNK